MKTVLIIGGGPAGLTAALETVRRGGHPVVIERDQALGGIARTVDRNGFKFDIGGHRFYTKIPRVMAFWKDILGDDFLRRPRLSRIFYDKKFYNYPLNLGNVVGNLGLVESGLCFVSFLRTKLRQTLPEENFETYIVNRFGRRLFNTFFKSYTEKVWGIPCREIRAAWAAQRIRGVSFGSAVRTAILGNRGKDAIKSLIDEFYYPKEGPGMLWERVGRMIEDGGGRIFRGAEVVRVHAAGRPALTIRHSDGRKERIEGDAVISTAAIRDLVSMLDPAPPGDVLDAAAGLRYRDFLTVGLIIDSPNLWPDNWIYIHDPAVRVGRIQNYKNWSPFMVPDPSKSGIGLEYFVFEGDDLWRMDDAALVEMGKRELAAIGLLPEGARVEDGLVIRMRKTYPMYDEGYDRRVEAVRDFLEKTAPNVLLVGRNGMHRYNNQDHSMYTAMLAVENLLDGARHDLWSVNVERVYGEEART